MADCKKLGDQFLLLEIKYVLEIERMLDGHVLFFEEYSLMHLYSRGKLYNAFLSKIISFKSNRKYVCLKL